MNSKITVAALAAGVSALGLAQTAQADVTIKTHMTIQSPMMDKMAAGQRDAMAPMMTSTTYMSGKRVRVESAVSTVIVDAGAHKMFMINPVQHTYSVMPYNTNMTKFSGKVTDTGQTSKVLGHPCRHYALDIKMAGANMVMHADIMAAQDLPPIDPSLSPMTAQLGVKGGQIKGVPLKVSSTMTSSATGKMTMTQTATSVSTAPIPAAKFAVPAGYKQTTQQGMFGGPGMMRR